MYRRLLRPPSIRLKQANSRGPTSGLEPMSYSHYELDLASVPKPKSRLPAGKRIRNVSSCYAQVSAYSLPTRLEPATFEATIQLDPGRDSAQPSQKRCICSTFVDAG